MANQYKELKDGERSLFDNGQWLEFVKSLKSGIYELKMKDFSKLRSLQVTCSKVNADAEHPYKVTTEVKYTDLVLRITINKR